MFIYVDNQLIAKNDKIQIDQSKIEGPIECDRNYYEATP